MIMARPLIEKAEKRTIDGIRKLLNPQYGNMTLEEEAAAVKKINPATQKHFELQIKILQDAPRDPDKLRELLKMKQRLKKQRLQKRYSHSSRRLIC